MTTEKEIEALRLIIQQLTITTRTLIYSTTSNPLAIAKLTRLCDMHNLCDNALEGLTFSAPKMINSPQIDQFMDEWNILAGSVKEFLEALNH